MENVRKKNYELKKSPEGFHGDQYLIKLVEHIAQSVSLFFETGTHVGSTLKYFAGRFPKIECFSCEPHEAAYQVALQDTQELSNVHIFNLKSSEFIKIIVNEYSLSREALIFCWLDSHGGPYPWELKKEVQFFTRYFNQGFLLIDDFRVPGKPQFQFNKYAEHRCDLPYVKNSINKKFSVYYPDYTKRTSSFHPLVGWGLVHFGITSINKDQGLPNARKL